MAGTTTVTRQCFNRDQEVITVAWLSDASGDVNGTSIPMTGIIFRVETVPSATVAPTDNYDITLTSPKSSSIDLMQSLTTNRDTANAEAVNFCGVDALTNGSPIYANGEYGFKVANAGNAKAGTVYIYLAK